MQQSKRKLMLEHVIVEKMGGGDNMRQEELDDLLRFGAAELFDDSLPAPETAPAGAWHWTSLTGDAWLHGLQSLSAVCEGSHCRAELQKQGTVTQMATFLLIPYSVLAPPAEPPLPPPPSACACHAMPDIKSHATAGILHVPDFLTAPHRVHVLRASSAPLGCSSSERRWLGSPAR